MKRTIHKFDSTGEAYDATQCDESIKTGDLLLISSEGVVGIADTWPVAVTKAHGDLHALKDGMTFETYQNGRFSEAATFGRKLAGEQA